MVNLAQDILLLLYIKKCQLIIYIYIKKLTSTTVVNAVYEFQYKS